MESLEKLKQVLLYKEIAEVNRNGDVLFLKDGTKVEFYMSDNDCWAVAYGDWKLSENFEGVITDVQFRHDKEVFYDENVNKLYITVFHNQNEIAQAECHADNGNGYYFSVLSVRVTNIDGKKIDDFTILEA